MHKINAKPWHTMVGTKSQPSNFPSIILVLSQFWNFSYILYVTTENKKIGSNMHIREKWRLRFSSNCSDASLNFFLNQKSYIHSKDNFFSKHIITYFN